MFLLHILCPGVQQLCAVVLLAEISWKDKEGEKKHVNLPLKMKKIK